MLVRGIGISLLVFGFTFSAEQPSIKPSDDCHWLPVNILYIKDNTGKKLKVHSVTKVIDYTRKNDLYYVWLTTEKWAWEKSSNEKLWTEFYIIDCTKYRARLEAFICHVKSLCSSWFDEEELSWFIFTPDSYLNFVCKNFLLRGCKPLHPNTREGAKNKN